MQHPRASRHPRGRVSASVSATPAVFTPLAMCSAKCAGFSKHAQQAARFQPSNRDLAAVFPRGEASCSTRHINQGWPRALFKMGRTVVCVGDSVADVLVHVPATFLEEIGAEPGGCTSISAEEMKPLLALAATQGDMIRYRRSNECFYVSPPFPPNWRAFSRVPSNCAKGG